MDKKRIDFVIKKFDELELIELYDIMTLRQEVFIVEQDCPYLDADGKDQDSWHILGMSDGILIAYSRIVPRGLSYPDYGSIGRVIVKEDYRGNNFGYELMKVSNDCAIKNIGKPLKLSAQTYAIPFYERLGYQPVGEEYLEDGLPHIAMILK